MLVWFLAFNCWLNCVAWSCSVACSDEHVASLCMFLSLEFQCLLFWTLLLRDAESDSEVFLICILCSTVHLSCRADVRLTLRMRFLTSLLLSILFQQYINDILWNFLNDLCQVYLNDILIYSKTQWKYKQHVKMILNYLWEADLQMNI
jgi:hypothetical protein